MKTSWIALIGLIPLVIGALIRYIICLRRFNRRDIGGLQRFPNFHMAFIVSLLEWIGMKVGALLIMSGIALLALEWYTGRL